MCALRVFQANMPPTEVDGNVDTLAMRGAKGTTSRDRPAQAPLSAPAATQLPPHPILDPDLELADNLDDSEHAPLHAPFPELPLLPPCCHRPP